MLFFSFFKSWIVHQLFGSMSTYKYGSVWCIDNCLPIASFNVLDENELKKSFGRINSIHMYVKENNSKETKINHHYYFVQQLKAY